MCSCNQGVIDHSKPGQCGRCGRMFRNGQPVAVPMPEVVYPPPAPQPVQTMRTVDAPNDLANDIQRGGVQGVMVFEFNESGGACCKIYGMLRQDQIIVALQVMLAETVDKMRGR